METRKKKKKIRGKTNQFKESDSNTKHILRDMLY